MATFKAEKVKKTEIPPLLFPPVLEVIFELRWELEVIDQQQGRLRDPSYPMMYGRLYDRLQKEYPVIEDLPTTQVHPEAHPYVVRHRLRKEQNGYPLMQIGPGVATFNESKGYGWTNFKSSALRLIESVIDLYPDQQFPLNFVKAELRYLNGIKFDFAKEKALPFLSDKLHMNVALPEALFGDRCENDPHTVNLNLGYPLKKPLGHVALSANLGQLEGKTAYLTQTIIQSHGETLPSDVDGFETWLKEAHETAEHCFQVLYQGALMDKFCGLNHG